jgi:hypothetical protein
MVARPQINLGEYLSFGELIKKNIDARKRVFVLDSNNIEGAIIHDMCRDSSFFFTKIARQPQGEELGQIKPFFYSSFN